MFTLTKITRYKTNKAGEPLINKLGKPYESVRIQVQEKPDVDLSGFGNQITDAWKGGDQVNIEITEKGEYMNFKTLEPIPKTPEQDFEQDLTRQDYVVEQSSKEDIITRTAIVKSMIESGLNKPTPDFFVDAMKFIEYCKTGKVTTLENYDETKDITPEDIEGVDKP